MTNYFLFDLDGTLFDTTEANIAAYSQAFQQVGLVFDETHYRQLFGLRFLEMMQQLAPEVDEATRNKVKALKSRFYKDNLDLVRPNHGLLALLQTISEDYKTALVTTASRSNVENLLTHFNVPQPLFDVIITGEDVAHGKPHPECYQLAADALQANPAECIVFEDSDIGVAAATAAGIKVIRINL
jgi:beta-phosphoglucomutase